MKKKIHPKFTPSKEKLDGIIQDFSSTGEPFGNQDRNSIKLFELDGKTINVKSFKIPNFINQIVYKFFRKPKAKRSFNYAKKLLELGIGTPQPIAYYYQTTSFFLKSSYYISEHLDVDLIFRELVENTNYIDAENILRQFTRFTYDLHEKGVYFLDHSPGNTLIKKNGTMYDFYLVDLNRMKFQNMSFEDRMQNFARLTPKKEMVSIMSATYAKLIDEDYKTVFDAMWHQTTIFQEKFHRKKRLKQKWLGKK